MTVGANGPARRQRVQGALAAKWTAIARGEVLVTALDKLGSDIGLGTETAMARAFAIVTGFTVRFVSLRRLVRR